MSILFEQLPDDALQGVHTVISTIGGLDYDSWVTPHLALLEAAKRAGVRRFVPSDWSFRGLPNDPIALYSNKAPVEEALRMSEFLREGSALGFSYVTAERSVAWYGEDGVSALLFPASTRAKTWVGMESKNSSGTQDCQARRLRPHQERMDGRFRDMRPGR